MRATRLFIGTMILIMAAIAGCGQKGTSDKPTGNGKSDREQMQETLNEVVARWHAGDKAVLYDNEFGYTQGRINFDQYLKIDRLALDADTVKAMNILDVEMFGGDSARAQVEVIFEGPTGKISRRTDSYVMYHYQGRWIRPTLGGAEGQRQWDSLKRVADSAAEAEEKDLGDK
jgi:hypothetical protein